MNDKEILLDLLCEFSARVRRVLGVVPPEALGWQPDPEANSIALTVWHFSRAFDVLKVRVLENRPCDEELWYTRGWAARTGYDPRGLGWGGLGNLAGYTLEEARAVPVLPAESLIEYFDQVSGALQGCLEAMPAEALVQPAEGWPAGRQSAYECIRNFFMDALGHLGEIAAIGAMWERQARAV